MEKKTKIALITIFFIIIAIIVGVLVWYIQKWEKSKKLNTPEEIAKIYFENINEKKYEEAYKLLTDESKQKISLEDFTKAYENYNKEIECVAVKTDNISCENIDVDTSNITYVNNIRSLYGDYKYGNNIYLKKQEDKKYYIDWNYNSIYPKYESTDKIVVNVDNAKRGNLMDRNGILLSGSGFISSIGLVPGWMNEETKTEDIKKVAELLNMSVDSVNKKMNASYVKEDTFVELDTVSKNETQLLASLREIDGIKIKDIESRVYPLNEKAAHVTGYVQKASKEDLEENKLYNENTLIAKAGLEKAYDERLRGKDGYEIILEDEKENKKATIFKSEKIEGENIKLTIDANLQSKVYDIYKGDNSATVIMDYGTGEILALISTPSYDPNKFLIGMTTQEWNNINNNSNNPMYTRFLKRYPPGSTFKPIIGAIALETGSINSYDEYEKSGLKWQKDSTWGSYYITTLKEYNSPANMENALINSDNIFFAKLALNIGSEKLEKKLKKLGFQSGFDFDMETKSSQISNDGKFANEIQLADSGYGQGEILVNPIQMAAIYSIFANNGNMIKPFIEIKQDDEPKFILEHVYSKNVIELMKDYLTQTIESEEGTGHSAKMPNLKIAGKTGTAETKSTKEEFDAKEVGWFNMFVTDENSDKQYVVISMIENVENKGGSQYVINKVKNIF